MPIETKTFRIFISSTFADWKVERDLLQARVWPGISRFCEERDCRFQAVDLRWGVSEEAARSARTMEVCLSEIERCQRLSPRPSFLILVGDRYGYRPVPEQIPDTEFRAILQHLPGCEREFLVGRPGQDDASGWYRLDENQVGGGGWRLPVWADTPCGAGGAGLPGWSGVRTDENRGGGVVGRGGGGPPGRRTPTPPSY